MALKAMAAILGTGFVYRLLFLAKIQLTTDELMQALVVRSDSAGAMLGHLRGGLILASPLDPLIQRGTVFLLGESTWSLRLHAVVLGTLSIWLCFRVARLLFGERVAVYSAALFALYPLHLHCSQQGLSYALSTFLALLSYDLLLRLVARACKGWQWWLAWTGIQALVMFSSPAGVAVLLAQCGALLLSHASKAADRRGPDEADSGRRSGIAAADFKTVIAWAGCALLVCVFFWPWAQYAWAGQTVAHPESLSFRLLRRILKELGDGSWPVTGLLIAGVATGAAAMLRHGRAQSLLWLSAWFVIPPVAVYLLDRWAGGPLAIGQILPCTPPLILVAGYGMCYVGERLTILDRLPSQISSLALVYATASALTSVAVTQGHWRKAPVDWQGTAQYLRQTLGAGDQLTVPAGMQLLEYYDPRLSEFASSEPVARDLSKKEHRAGRVVVVCLASLRPDPCVSVRAEAKRDRSWGSREFNGLTVFIRN